MKNILHLKDDTEYQIPLRETEKDDRAEVGTTEAENTANKEKVNDRKKTDKTSQEEVNNEKEVNNENDSALDNLEEENSNQESINTEESNSGAPQVDTAKAALDEMKKLASQEGVIHPSLFISNFSKILGLMERAMQLQVEESGSVTKEEASGATEEKTSESTETPAEG